MFDVIIKGGMVVAPEGAAIMDVGIQGERIAAVAASGTLDADGARVIDATGKIVLPGGIEPHTHINVPVPDYWAGGKSEVFTQPPEAASRAAAFGGVTTYVDFAGNLPLTPGAVPTAEPIMSQIDKRRETFTGHSYTDFTFHYILAGAVSPQTIGEIGEAIQSGLASFKGFTTFFAKIPTGHLWAVFQEVSKHGGIMAVHAEEDDIVTFMEEKLIREGNDHGSNLHLAYNNPSEDIVFRKVIRLAESTETGIYFVHTTAKEGVAAVAEARAKQLPVYGEALHNYLEFTCEGYKKPGGLSIHTYPAIKYPDDRDALQQGLVDGPICTTATDEWTTYKDVKLAGDTIKTVCGGHNGIETRVGVAYSEGVVNQGMSLQRFVDITSANAAKIFGLYPRKGALAAGSEADITIIDPTIDRPLTMDDFHLEDYSIWEGWDIQGWPVTTILRGKVMVEDGQFFGSPTDGQFIPRKIAPEILSRPAC